MSSHCSSRHRKEKHSIEIYKLESGQSGHNRTLSDPIPILTSPNNVVAVGPDNPIFTVMVAGLCQGLKNIFRLRLSNVVYRDGSRFAEAASNIGHENRMLIGAVFDPKFLDCKW